MIATGGMPVCSVCLRFTLPLKPKAPTPSGSGTPEPVPLDGLEWRDDGQGFRKPGEETPT